MSHDTHEHHHHDAQNDKPVIAFRSGIYFVLILAGLFIASMAFIKAMSDNEGGHGGHHTEAAEHGAATHEEATHEGAAHEEATHEEHNAAAHEEATPATHEAPAEHH